MGGVIRISLLFSLLFCYSASNAQDDCSKDQIVAARAQYDIGKFIQCLDLLKPCLEKSGFHNDDKVQANELCAMCYLAMDSVAKADHYIEQLVTQNDNYTGGASGNPERLKMEVAYVRLQLRSTQTSSVSKKPEKIELAPATMQIITDEEIENRGYLDLESVLYDLPGFDISRNFGITYSVLYQRGYRSAAFTERTLILIDGVQDNELFSNSAYITKQYPLSNVKRIEIIYGPASTLYGTNAFCGVINIVTKDESDFFAGKGGATANEQPKNVALNLQAGTGSYNTQYVDGTVSARHKDVFFTATGRVYTSDGTDLSSDNRWDGSPNLNSQEYITALSMANTTANSKYLSSGYFTTNTKGDSIIPSAAGIARARAFDSSGYTSTKFPNYNQFKNSMTDFYLSAKLTVNNFKFGFQYWNKNEGAVGDFVDLNASVNSAYTNWQVRQFFTYVQYDRAITDHLSLSSLSYYEYSDLGNDTKVLHYYGYAGEQYNADSLIKGVHALFKPTYYSQQSNMFRTELKLPYRFNDYFDVLGGTSLTTGIDQGNYLTSSTASGIQNATVSSQPGGNDLTEFTLSGYLTGGYHNRELKLNIDAGGRLDNNSYRNDNGYGTVFNPRYDVVYYPGNFIFKAIYSEAFMDASALNKYSTSATRAIANPTLPPEKVTNYEISARYKFSEGKKDYVELAAYRAYYTHSLGYVLVAYNGGYTDKYADIGASLVYGLQASSQIYILKNISIFANATYTNPQSTYISAISGKDSINFRTGDIANYSANAGVNISFFKKHFNLNTRVNIVGDKPTGAKTSVSGNPLSDIPAYQLLNATLGYRFHRNYLIQVGCNNILNLLYYSPGVRDANDIVYPSSVPQPLRNYYLKFSISLRQ